MFIHDTAIFPSGQILSADPTTDHNLHKAQSACCIARPTFVIYGCIYVYVYVY